MHCSYLASSAGLEPAAYGLGNRRSIHLSYEDIPGKLIVTASAIIIETHVCKFYSFTETCYCEYHSIDNSKNELYCQFTASLCLTLLKMSAFYLKAKTVQSTQNVECNQHKMSIETSHRGALCIDRIENIENIENVRHVGYVLNRHLYAVLLYFLTVM